MPPYFLGFSPLWGGWTNIVWLDGFCHASYTYFVFSQSTYTRLIDLVTRGSPRHYAVALKGISSTPSQFWLHNTLCISQCKVSNVLGFVVYMYINFLFHVFQVCFVCVSCCNIISIEKKSQVFFFEKVKKSPKTLVNTRKKNLKKNLKKCFGCVCWLNFGG